MLKDTTSWTEMVKFLRKTPANQNQNRKEELTTTERDRGTRTKLKKKKIKTSIKGSFHPLSQVQIFLKSYVIFIVNVHVL